MALLISPGVYHGVIKCMMSPRLMWIKYKFAQVSVHLSAHMVLVVEEKIGKGHFLERC